MDSRRERAEMRIGYRLLGIGFQTSSEVAAGLILGWVFDWFRGHGNIGVIVGGIGGVAIAMFTLVRQGLKISRELDELDRGRRTTKRPPADPPWEGPPSEDWP